MGQTYLDNESLMQPACKALGLVFCFWKVGNDELCWNGNFREVLKLGPRAEIATIKTFQELIFPEDRVGFEAALNVAQQNQNPFEYQFRIPNGSSVPHWFSMRGRFIESELDEGLHLICMISDFSERKKYELELVKSVATSKALNERLQTAMGESHHRIKNSLQNILSLLNLQVRKSGSVSADAVKKLSAHIHGLAVVHDLLNEQSGELAEVTAIALDRIFERLIAILARGGADRPISSTLESCTVSPRQAASLTVIFNEVVSNAMHFGSGPISISLEGQGDKGLLIVKNEGSQFPPNFAPDAQGQTGLALVKLLCNSDLTCEPVFENTSATQATVSISIPLLRSRKKSAV